MEYEQMMTLTTVRGFGRICWEALGQSLVVEVDIRHRDGHTLRLPGSLPRELAEELHRRLGEALAEKPREEPTRQ